MRILTPHRLLPLSALVAFLAAGFCASTVSAATPQQPAKRSFLSSNTLIEEAPPEPLDPPTVIFGEVMFDYYQQRSFPAITNLLIARDNKVLSDKDDYAEMLLGDLYTSFDLVTQAESIFSRIMKRDILPKTRSETWFHTARVQYTLGKYDEAARILENKISNLSPQIEKERAVMLGNIYINRGEFQKAADTLANFKADDIIGAFALYNLGTAFVLAGENDRGLGLLKQVRDLPPGDEETNALKDRAALAIGYTWIQKGNNDLARESLLTIRMDGPFTNQAMLGLGYANFQRKDFKRALPLWLELLQRNTSDTTVQEALMLAPRAYEELGALPQALFGYRYAADTLRGELKKVERTILRVREGDWLSSLSPVDGKEILSADPLAPVVDFTVAKVEEAPYLYGLFASNAFATDYKMYLSLQRMQRLIDQWLDQLPIFQATLSQHRAQLAGLRPVLDDVIQRRSRDVEALRSRVAPLDARIDTAIRKGDLEQTATVEQLAMLDRIHAIEGVLPYGGAQYAERARRMKGLLIWDITAAAPQQQEKAVKEIEKIKLDLDSAALHLEALKRQREDINRRMALDMDNKISSSGRRLQVLKDEVSQQMQRQVVILQNQALVVLAENRRNLGAQLAETHLSIARLQDASVSDVIEKRKRQ